METKETHGQNGTNGIDGTDGEDGIGVSEIVEQYYLSTSNSTQTGGSWQTTQPTWQNGKYIWIRSKITWTDNTTTYTTPILADSVNKANETAYNTNQNLITNYYTKSEINVQNDRIEERIDAIEDLTNEATGIKSVTLQNCVVGSLLEMHIFGNNSVFDALYPLNNLYPANNLYPYGDSRIVVTDENNNSKIYELGITDVLRQNGDVQDEYVLEYGQAKVIRRINADGTIKQTETIEELGDFAIDIANGTNTITIKNYSASLNVKYAIKSDFTEVFATKVEMNSSITQTAEEINLEVRKKVDENEVISKINQSAEAVGINANKINLSANDVLNLLSGNTINLSGRSIRISSNNFNVDENGNMSCNNAEVRSIKIINGNLIMYTDGSIYITDEEDYDNAHFRATSKDGNQITRLTSNGFFTQDSLEGDMSQMTHDSVVTPVLIQTSLQDQKKNFEKYTNALDTIKKVDIYKYNLKSEDDNSKKHIGFVIGKDFKYSEEVTSKNNDGADIYSFVSLCCQAIKEQQEEIEKLRKEINNG